MWWCGVWMSRWRDLLDGGYMYDIVRMRYASLDSGVYT